MDSFEIHGSRAHKLWTSDLPNQNPDLDIGLLPKANDSEPRTYFWNEAEKTDLYNTIRPEFYERYKIRLDLGTRLPHNLQTLILRGAISNGTKLINFIEVMERQFAEFKRLNPTPDVQALAQSFVFDSNDTEFIKLWDALLLERDRRLSKNLIHQIRVSKNFESDEGLFRRCFLSHAHEMGFDCRFISPDIVFILKKSDLNIRLKSILNSLGYNYVLLI